MLPQELEVWYLIPAVRKELASALVKQGFSQRKVAELLKVTEPAVSQYFKNKRAGEVKFDAIMKNEIHRSAIGMINHKSCFIKEVSRILKIARKTGVLCSVHKRLDDINCSCEVCFR